MGRKSKILVTNDDGIYAPGIYALYKAMKEIGDTYVVAPDYEKSAVGHAITISDPLRVLEVERNGEFFGWAVNGTPADCVKLAAKAIFDFKVQNDSVQNKMVFNLSFSESQPGSFPGWPCSLPQKLSKSETDGLEMLDLLFLLPLRITPKIRPLQRIQFVLRA